MLEEIRHGDTLLAVILRAGFSAPGVSFVTSNDLTQQLAYMQHPAGARIRPHVHNPAPRQVEYTTEVLVIKRGSLRVDLYTQDQHYLHSRLLQAGDTILLVGGGHGFEVLEDLEMLEIKQGPFVGEIDKTRFDPPTDLVPRILI